MNAIEAARLILEANAAGAEIVSVLCVSGSAAGTRVLVRPDGSLLGTFGSSEFDDDAANLAQDVFTTRAATRTDQLFAELHVPVEDLVIFGAGHIALPLAEIGAKLGFAVTVLDDRTEFASEERFPPPIQVHMLDYADPLHNVTLTRNSYVVLVTRAHKYDFDCLRAVLEQSQQPRYIGMIGSRRRVRAAFTALVDGGVPREKLEHLHAPIGIDIGAETPAEIAISIAAELVRERRGGSAESLGTIEHVAARFFAEPSP